MSEGSRTTPLKKGALSLMSTVAPLFARATADTERMRILAYHDVPDRENFAEQMSYISDQFHPVDIEDVVRYTAVGKAPKRAVWITFDDGDPTVIANALPVLQHFEIRATMFICPGLVDTQEPYWWQIVELAEREGLIPEAGTPKSGAVTRLKSVPDQERRSEVRSLHQRLALLLGAPPERNQVTTTEIDVWVGAGHAIHNHTWNHPILPMASVEEQRTQVMRAHEWIRERYPTEHAMFAYPNGDVSGFTRDLLQKLDYQAAVLFDHRVAKPSDRFALSRIRVNGSDSLESYRARVSGLHPAVNSLRSRLSTWWR